MNDVVSSLFCMMHFPHNGSITTIDQLDYVPLFIPSVSMGTTLPWVNYVVSYPMNSISI